MAAKVPLNTILPLLPRQVKGSVGVTAVIASAFVLVTVKVQGVEVLPDASVAVILTLTVPVPLTAVPGAGVCVFVSEPEAVQLSVALTRLR